MQRGSPIQLLPPGQLQICLEATALSMSLVLHVLDATLTHGIHKQEQDTAGWRTVVATALNILQLLAAALKQGTRSWKDAN